MPPRILVPSGLRTSTPRCSRAASSQRSTPGSVLAETIEEAKPTHTPPPPPQQNDKMSLLHQMTSRNPSRNGARSGPGNPRFGRRGGPGGGNLVEDLEAHQHATDMERYMNRRWRQGDIYAPHDLSSTETRKWRVRRGPARDALDVLGLKPVNEYKNFALMSEYVTEMGRIRHSRDTALRPVNQRRIARAIRRAVGIGLMPSVHRHPELLEQERSRR